MKSFSAAILAVRRIRLRFFFLLFFSLSFSNSYSLNIITDAEIESGIKLIVSPIIKAAGMKPEQVNIYIVADTQINAFAINGKNIFVNTGLLMLYNDVDVIKGVFAHELGHVTGGHIVRTHQKMEELASQHFISTLLGIAAIAGGGGEAGAAVTAGSSQFFERSMLRFSRENEYSADQAAIKYLRGSRNSIEGLEKIQEYFLSRYSSVDLNKYKYMLTHPPSNERLFAIRSVKKWDIDHKRNDIDQIIYSRIFAKLRGFISSPDIVLKGNRYDLKPFSRDYEVAIAHYRSNNLKKSMKLLDKLIAQEPYNPFIYELKAQFLFEYGDLDGALPSYEKALQLNPNDELLKKELAIVLINSANKIDNDSEKKKYYIRAVELLNQVLVKHPNDIWAYRNLSIAYGRMGKIAESNVMLAEESIRLRKYRKAHKFIRNANKHGFKKMNKSLQIRAQDIIREIRDANKRDSDER